MIADADMKNNAFPNTHFHQEKSELAGFPVSLFSPHIRRNGRDEATS